MYVRDSIKEALNLVALIRLRYTRYEIVVTKDNLAQKCHVVEIIDVIYD